MLIVFQDLTVPAAFCFATGMYATCSVPVLLYGTTWQRDLHQAAVHTAHTLNHATSSARHHLAPHTACIRHAAYSAREVGRDVAALLLMLTTIPTGDR